MDLTLSPTCQDLLHQLRAIHWPVGGPGQLRPREAEILEQLELAAEPGVVPQLVLFGMTANPEQRERADGVAASILDSLDIVRLMDFGSSLRRHPYPLQGDLARWAKLTAAELQSFRTPQVTAPVLVGAASFHANGRVREAAVRILDEADTGAELRFLLIRLNDWVESVRSAAERAIQRRFKPEYAEAFARNADLIERLAYWGRADHSSLLRWIFEFLRAPDSVRAVLVFLDTGDVAPRRVLYRVLLDPGRPCDPGLIERALTDSDPVCCLLGIRAVAKLSSADAQRSSLRRALAHPFAAVRLVAARGLAFSFSDEPEETFVELLMDSAASVRVVARHRLRQAGWNDFLGFYTAQFETRSAIARRIAVKAIGEVGDAGSAALVLPFLSASDSRLAAAVLGTLAVLDGDAHVEQFVAAMRSGQPALTREAAVALAGRIPLVDLEELRSIGNSLPWGFARRRILPLLFAAPKWDALLNILTSLRDSEPAAVELAREHLARWMVQFNRRSSPLTPGHQQRLRQAIQSLATELPPDRVRTLTFMVG
jgi:HEAT repeat protein